MEKYAEKKDSADPASAFKSLLSYICNVKQGDPNWWVTVWILFNRDSGQYIERVFIFHLQEENQFPQTSESVIIPVWTLL